LPPALRGLVQEIESYRLAQTSHPEQILAASTQVSSAEKLQRYFFVARRLIDYMEFHVIGNDSVLMRQKVASSATGICSSVQLHSIVVSHQPSALQRSLPDQKVAVNY